MSGVGWAVVCVAGLVAVVWGVLVRLARAGAALVATRRPDARIEVKTADGWVLGCDTYRSEGRARGAIVLCHGLCATAEGADVDPADSLAPALRARGYAVLVANLRGRAGTTPPAGTGLHDYGFEDHVRGDAPALVEAARGLADGAGVTWIGHSMGGLVGYRVAAADRRVRGLVAIASPAGLSFEGIQAFALRSVRWIRRTPLRRLPLAFFSRAAASLAGRWFPPVFGTLDRRNFSRPGLRGLLAHGVADLPVRLAFELVAWGLSHDGSDTLKREFDGALARLDVPLLCFAGTGDEVVPLTFIEEAFHRTAGADRTLVVVDGTGLGAPPGHADLLAGIPARTVVLPRLLEWLDARNVSAGAPATVG